jgi:hypothetical protein
MEESETARIPAKRLRRYGPVSRQRTARSLRWEKPFQGGGKGRDAKIQAVSGRFMTAEPPVFRQRGVLWRSGIRCPGQLRFRMRELETFHQCIKGGDVWKRRLPGRFMTAEPPVFRQRGVLWRSGDGGRHSVSGPATIPDAGIGGVSPMYKGRRRLEKAAKKPSGMPEGFLFRPKIQRPRWPFRCIMCA